MTGELRLFPGITTLNHDPNIILELAKKGDLTEVVILGYDKDGRFFFSASKAAGPDVLWLLELAKSELIGMAR